MRNWRLCPDPRFTRNLGSFRTNSFYLGQWATWRVFCCQMKDFTGLKNIYPIFKTNVLRVFAKACTLNFIFWCCPRKKSIDLPIHWHVCQECKDSNHLDLWNRSFRNSFTREITALLLLIPCSLEILRPNGLSLGEFPLLALP